MTRRRNRLYGYVRQATHLDGERSAALGDNAQRDILFEEITQMNALAEQTQPTLPLRRRRRPALIAVGAVTAAAAALTSLLVWRDSPSAPSATGPSPTTASAQASASAPAQPYGDVFGGQTSLGCVEEYNPQNLAKRAFAFDATVVSVGALATGEQVDLYVPVVFQVNHWYRGGTGNRITVAMLPPLLETSVDNVTYRVGSRLLVSGEDRSGNTTLTDPVAWACGFTRWYSNRDEPIWTQAFR